MTTPAPKVSAILATYNRANYIREAIDSLLQQTRPPDEIVVVDDGSTDDTADVLHSYGARIRYLHKSNGGKSSALNLALDVVQSDYIWVFDDDDIALPHALASHLTFLATHTEYDFSYSPQHVFHGEFCSSDIETRPTPTLPGFSGKQFFVRTMESMHSMMQGMLVPLRCYKEVGPFDETFIRAQDHDMVLRLARRFRAGYLNKPTFALRMHQGIRGGAHASHSEKDRARIWQKYRTRIFRRLYKSLALTEYLPSVSTKTVLTPQQQRQALAQRFCIMTRNGIHDHAIADYTRWRKLLQNDAPAGDEKMLLSRAVQVEDISILPPSSFLWHIGRTTGPKISVLKLLARGLYWSSMREIRHRKPGNAVTMGGSFIFLCAGTLTPLRR